MEPTNNVLSSIVIAFACKLARLLPVKLHLLLSFALDFTSQSLMPDSSKSSRYLAYQHERQRRHSTQGCW